MTRWQRRAGRAAFALVLGAAVLVAAALIFGAAAADALLNRSPRHPGTGSPRAQALAARLRIVDLHADSLLWGRDLLRRSTRGHVDVPRLVEGHVALQAFTVVTQAPAFMSLERNGADDFDHAGLLARAAGWPTATHRSLLARALFQAERLRDLAARSEGRLTLIRTRRDLDEFLARRAREPERVAGLLGLEGSQALEHRLENVDVLYDAGFRMAAPTHFTDTEVGGSAHGEKKNGLTPLGLRWLQRMEEKHMLVDVAHASARTLEDVLARARRPIVVSHTGVRATCDNGRNLSDEQLRGVARTGGVVGIAYFPRAVCGSDARAIARAIVHAVSVAGPAHVGLGSDFDGAVSTPFDTTGLPLLIDALLAAGMDEATLAQVLGENALRVLAEVLPPG